jgi:hypothetical protein
MAAVVGAMLKRKETKRKQQRQIRLNQHHDHLTHHVAHIIIAPFPRYPPKWVKETKT